MRSETNVILLSAKPTACIRNFSCKKRPAEKYAECVSVCVCVCKSYAINIILIKFRPIFLMAAGVGLSKFYSDCQMNKCRRYFNSYTHA